ncbi:Clan CA, family C1, cathepsin L-like cysteine peptidase [Tritrichomonas foetus]|uniref:Clan CA, family C1, cathepsin L-like cysteine peptidase n=1 Tax=Tritrichomonas foetus TaxID=1144522 RepID=A0A1J4JSY3_9EUKA|nr:Clan CA, family C1, cathepsin L-like cysteine peptidase [Tritrichomonas foetus]|eukprot:OHT02179.1 Clan CA, family C1, cathepsin L-like cysteine peptidase [Tritrichomonas foetus]
MRQNNQFYTGDEYHFRLGLFLSHSRWINEFNKQGHSFRVAHNKFSTYTPAEYKALLGFKNVKTGHKGKKSTKKVNAPESLDWRESGLVNPIKDQASCGSCWAFSAIATCESAYAKSSGKLLSFSEQNIVDCVLGCYGCSGGWPNVAIDHVLDNQNGQFNSEDDYPYTALDGNCVYDASKAIGKVTGYLEVEYDSESDLKEKVAGYGVVSVCIQAGTSAFMSYTGGIFDYPDCSQTFLDHAVAAVGYGAENGVEYWIVRNSWGTSWGEEGYVRMIRNKQNQCGIANEAVVAY